jgi:hypothetical protein
MQSFYGKYSISRGMDSPGSLVIVPSQNFGRVTIMLRRCPCFQVNDPVVRFSDVEFLTPRFGPGKEPKMILMATGNRSESWGEIE